MGNPLNISLGPVAYQKIALREELPSHLTAKIRHPITKPLTQNLKECARHIKTFSVTITLWKLNGCYSDKAGNGYVPANSLTSFFIWTSSGNLEPSPRAAFQSFNLLASLGSDFCRSAATLIARSIKSTILTNSSSLKPRVVMAGAPTRIPPGLMALVSIYYQSR